MLAVGIDTGGTFTDFVVASDGAVTVHKVLSTPDNPAEAVLRGLRDTVGIDADMDVTHGSTVATNALLERKGARTALVTTEGFEDVLLIGRQTRSELYNLFVSKPPALVPEDLCFGVPERILYTGEVEHELEIKSVERVLAEIQKKNVQSVAICLLHSYANPVHEEEIARLAKRFIRFVSASHRILPEYREYERCSTTVVNAYLSPLISDYVSQLGLRLARSRLRVMKSNGGSISAETAGEESVHTILSGPAGGVVGATEIARRAGYENVITFDMGGTSTDVSLCRGEYVATTESVVAGCPLKVPMIDIHTVGAGGGSVAWLDQGGALRVGPESAGADPGPACYGKGDRVTVTDANLVLGRLHPDHFLGGTMRLDVDRARAALAGLAGRLGLTEEEAASGVIRVANVNMERAMRVISVERGNDPREFSLVSFGGAGAMHACDLARSLSIPAVLVPRDAGVLSALGMLLADVVKDYSQTVLVESASSEHGEIERLFQPLIERALEDMAKEGFGQDRLKLHRYLDMRYVGQSYEISVPFTEDFQEAFHDRHRRIYSYARRGRATEIVNLRLKAVGVPVKPTLEKKQGMDRDARSAVVELRNILFDGGFVEATVYSREKLRPGNEFTGPALVVEFSATTVVPPDFTCRVDELEDLVLRPKA